MVLVYTAVMLLLACGGQLSSILRTGRVAEPSRAVGGALQPHKINLPVYCLHILLGWSRPQGAWSVLTPPPVDMLPSTVPDGTLSLPPEEWPHLLSPLLFVFGAAVAYWGSTLLRLLVRLVSLVLALLHR